MIRPRIRIVAETMSGEIAELEAALQRSPDADARARTLAELSARCRAAGIAALLARLDLRSFRGYLRRAAEHWHALLSMSRQQPGAASLLAVASDVAGYCCAVVAGEGDLARAVAALSPTERMDDQEMADEFWYARFLYASADPDPRAAAGARACEMLEASLAGEETARLLICRALLGGDKRLFEAGMRLLVEENHAQQKKRESFIIQGKDRYWTERFICIEGLALLAIADRRGLGPDADYPGMPRHARYHDSPA